MDSFQICKVIVLKEKYEISDQIFIISGWNRKIFITRSQKMTFSQKFLFLSWLYDLQHDCNDWVKNELRLEK